MNLCAAELICLSGRGDDREQKACNQGSEEDLRVVEGNTHSPCNGF